MATRPLTLVNATLELLDAAIADPPRLARMLGATIASGWEGFPEALPGLRRAYVESPGEARWGTVFFRLDEPRTLVGLGGYKGGPAAGVVEVGYAIAPAFRERGLATSAVRQLVGRAFEDMQVLAVDAHTLAQTTPSSRVLEKVGFRRIGERQDPDDGRVWHWRLRREDLTGG